MECSGRFFIQDNNSSGYPYIICMRTGVKIEFVLRLSNNEYFVLRDEIDEQDLKRASDENLIRKLSKLKEKGYLEEEFVKCVEDLNNIAKNGKLVIKVVQEKRLIDLKIKSIVYCSK